MNSPKWLEFIGDRGVRGIEDAKSYLEDGPIKSYKENGFGLWLAQLKDTNEPIGMCGLVNRESLDDIDIGFAMLSEYFGFGYGFEMASATLSYTWNQLGLDRIVAITDPNNMASIKLLNKIGLNLEKTLKLAGDDEVLLFSAENDKGYANQNA